VPRYTKKAKENGERFKPKCRYTETITQLSNQNITIKHGVDVTHYFSHLIRANASRNKIFINSAKKLEAFPVLTDYMLQASG